ncbi:hypothetical protein As57867_004534, partial [Aphanomyces stellatus]
MANLVWLVASVLVLPSVAAAACSYNTGLAKGVINIQVCDKTLCGSTGECVVDKACVLQPANSSWQAVGSYVDCRNKQVTLSPGAGISIDMSKAVFSNDTTYIVLQKMALSFTTPPIWPNALLRMDFIDVELPAGSLNLPSSINDVNVLSSKAAEFPQFNISVMYMDLINNPNMRRIANLRVNNTLRIINMTVTSWVIDTATYKILNGLWGGMYGYSGGGYDCYNSTIESDPTECAAQGGTIKPIFTDNGNRPWYKNATYTNAVFTVCVLSASSSTSPVATPKPVTTQPGASDGKSTNPGQPTSPATSSPEPTGTGISTGAVVGIAAAALAVIGLVLWMCCVRKKKSARYSPGMMPMLQPNETNERVVTNGSTTQPTTQSKQNSQPSSGELDLRGLELYRIQDKDIQLVHVIGSGAFADVWTGT